MMFLKNKKSILIFLFYPGLLYIMRGRQHQMLPFWIGCVDVSNAITDQRSTVYGDRGESAVLQ